MLHLFRTLPGPHQQFHSSKRPLAYPMRTVLTGGLVLGIGILSGGLSWALPNRRAIASPSDASLSLSSTPLPAGLILAQGDRSETANPQNSAASSPSQRPDQPLLQRGSTGPDVVEVQAILQLLGFYSDPIDGRFGDSTAIAVTQFQQASGLAADGIVGPGTWSRLLPTPERLAAPSEPSSSEELSSSSSFPVPEALTPPDSDTPPETSTVGVSNRVSEPSTASPEPISPSQTTNAAPRETAPSANTDVTTVELPILRRGMRGAAVVVLQERLRALGMFAGAIDGIFGVQTEAAVVAAQRQFQLTPDGVVGTATWNSLVGP